MFVWESTVSVSEAHQLNIRVLNADGSSSRWELFDDRSTSIKEDPTFKGRDLWVRSALVADQANYHVSPWKLRLTVGPSEYQNLLIVPAGTMSLNFQVQ